MATQDDMKDIERERDCREWKLTDADYCEKDVWRSNVRSAMCAASQLPGGEPTDVDDAPGCVEIQCEICHVCS